MDLPKNYEIIQQKYTSNSRGTRMGRRVTKNVVEFAPRLKPPILMVGCGDGLELEYMSKQLNIPATEEYIKGIEVTSERVAIAQANNLPIVLGAAENILDITGETKYNIYCAHTLEHCFNRNLVIEGFKKVALDTIVIIVPIELSGRTRNRAHYSPISNLGGIANQFGMDWQITSSYRFNIELEGVLILQRDPMNWPKKIAQRSSELRVKG